MATATGPKFISPLAANRIGAMAGYPQIQQSLYPEIDANHGNQNVPAAAEDAQQQQPKQQAREPLNGANPAGSSSPQAAEDLGAAQPAQEQVGTAPPRQDDAANVANVTTAATTTTMTAAADPQKCRWTNCDQKFDSSEELYKHLCDDHVGRKSSNNLDLTCRWDNCQTTSVKRDHLTSHIRVHVDFKPHACLQCRKKFKRVQDLKKHEKTHSDQQTADRQTQGPAAAIPSVGSTTYGHPHPFPPHHPHHPHAPGTTFDAAHLLRPAPHHPLQALHTAPSYYGPQPTTTSSPYDGYYPNMAAAPRADHGLGAHGLSSHGHISAQCHHHCCDPQSYNPAAAATASRRSKRTYEEVDHDAFANFWEGVKRRPFIPNSFDSIARSLEPLHSSLLGATEAHGGAGAGTAVHAGGGYLAQPPHLITSPAHAHMAATHGPVPAPVPAQLHDPMRMGGHSRVGPTPWTQRHFLPQPQPQFTRKDLLDMGGMVDKMQTTIFGTSQTGHESHHIREHDALSSAIPVTAVDHYAAITAPHAASPQASASSGGTPAISPLSRRPSSHTTQSPSPTVSSSSSHISRHGPTGAMLYPHLPTQPMAPFAGQVPPATLGASMDPGRRYGGGMLQSARVILPMHPRQDTTAETGRGKVAEATLDAKCTIDPRLKTEDGEPPGAASTTPVEETGSSGSGLHRPSTNGTAPPTQVVDYDRWFKTVTVLGALKVMIREALEDGYFVDDDNVEAIGGPNTTQEPPSLASQKSPWASSQHLRASV